MRCPFKNENENPIINQVAIVKKGFQDEIYSKHIYNGKSQMSYDFINQRNKIRMWWEDICLRKGVTTTMIAMVSLSSST